ncbi:MAG: DUF167 domain-containing protein [Candidatus Tectomicrobia bacterium]|uniref:UPF0235 protein HYY20_09205 n=1 Tax=Tectimicrobiota bacterium TaxID=2528274 RepID=A0A932G1A4_UNCTE|nr:DUF167 domain-containing protein [Candidatus Tectomicrobia bacterium]
MTLPSGSDKPGLNWQEGPQGISFGVRVQPRASRNEIVGTENGILKVRLTSPPVKGEANAHCIELLAHWLGVSKGRISILKGTQAREKLVLVEGLTSQELDASLRKGLKAQGS